MNLNRKLILLKLAIDDSAINVLIQGHITGFTFTIILMACSMFLKGQSSISGDSLHYTSSKGFMVHQTIVPASLIVSGLLVNYINDGALNFEVAEERDENIQHFNTHIDDYLQYTPLIAMYTLDAFKIPSASSITRQTWKTITAELMMATTVTVLKHSTKILRPDSSSSTSFPSGHTAQAFCFATILNQEFGGKYRWLPYASYTVASTVGILRIANDRHYLGDVLVGAGIGILSAQVSQVIFPPVSRKKEKLRDAKF